MTNTEFQQKLESIYAKYPLIKRSEIKTLNELIYVLRMEYDDYCISDNKGGCIPSVKQTFVPTRWLARKIKSVEWDENCNNESDTNVIFIDYVEEDE